MTTLNKLAAAFLVLAPLLAGAEPLETRISLRDLENEPGERLAGTGVSKDYFFPLPVRGVEAESITGTVLLRVSPLIGPNSLATVRANDQPVAVRVLSGESAETTLEFTVPLKSYAKSPTSDFLKLTVEAILDLPEDEDRCETLAAGSIWIEVDSDSEVRVAFESTNPDWLSVARLPQSLRHRVHLQTPAEVESPQMDLAMKVAGWLAYVRPTAEISIGPQTMEAAGNADRFVLAPAEPGKASIEVAAEGAGRVITISASSEAQVEEVWESFRLLDRFRVPGSRWDRLLRKGNAFPDKLQKSITAESLDPSFTARNVGIGGMSRTIDFDLALFGERPAELELNVAGRCREVHREGSATFSVFLNDILVFTDNLEPDTTEFSYQVKLRPELLRGENRVVVALDYAPSDEECRTPLFNFFWQLDPRSNLTFRDSSDLPDPDSLLEAAQQFFGRNQYAAIVPGPEDLTTACLTAVWLQRVNTPFLLEPYLSESLPERGPAVAVGNASALAENGSMRLPVAAREGALRFSSPKGDDFFQAASNDNLGIFQLAYQGPERPVLLADPWGPRGAAALGAMMYQVANEPWFGGGDLLLGNGVVPPLGVETDMLVEGEWLPPRPIDELGFQWRKWRWWFVGGLWLIISAVILWIFSKSRANATRG